MTFREYFEEKYGDLSIRNPSMAFAIREALQDAWNHGWQRGYNQGKDDPYYEKDEAEDD